MIQRKFKTIVHLVCKIGIFYTMVNLCILAFYKLMAGMKFMARNKIFQFYMPHYPRPVFLRYGTSDLSAWHQVFFTQEDSYLDSVNEPKLIIDCGAYAGYSSLHFLNKYPSAYVIAVEPEEGNFNICKKNLYPYGSRVTLRHSAVSSSSTGMVICKAQFMDKHEWSTQVRPCRLNEKPDIQSTDIESLIRESGFEIVDILKIEI